MDISSVLDMFGSFGKPLHVTAVGVPSQAATDPNDQSQGKLEVVYCPYMTAGHAIMLGKAAKKNLVHWVRKPPTRSEQDHPRNRSFSWFMHMRILFGVLHYKSIVGHQ